MKTLLIFLCFTLNVACSTMATATMIKETKDGGRVRLNGTGSVWQEGSENVAKQMMAAKCPNGYEVIETGVVDKTLRINVGRKTAEEKYEEFKCL